MAITMKRIVIDLDATLTLETDDAYPDKLVNNDVLRSCRYYKEQGFEIVIATSRNMRTYDGNVGKINANTLPIIIEWLNKHRVPYDEIYIGKPWCGLDGFYVDDKAIRPSEFSSLSLSQVYELLDAEKKLNAGSDQ